MASHELVQSKAHQVEANQVPPLMLRQDQVIRDGGMNGEEGNWEMGGDRRKGGRGN